MARTISRADSRIRETLAVLERAYGEDVWHWMPDRARPIEIIAGAILVQQARIAL